MKKLMSIFLLISLVVISACRKSDNPTLPDGIVYINQPQVLKVSGSAAILDTDPMSFDAKVSVDLFFKNSEKPDYLDLMVVKNGDAANAKLLKGNISTYPTEVGLNGQLLTDMFGTISGGDNFDIAANYIVGGKTYLAFPLGGGSPYGSGVGAQAGGASPLVRYSAICGFVADDFVGDGRFEVVTDGWEDFGVKSEAQVNKVDESTISITYPIASFKPIILKINTADNTVTVAKQELGTYGGSWQYGTLSVASIGGGTANYINPCNGIIRINGDYTVSAGGFGAFVLQLKKK